MKNLNLQSKSLKTRYTYLKYNAHKINRMSERSMEILNLISKCREIRDVGKKFSLLEYINQLLPAESKIKLPALITNDGIDNLLSWIEVKISPPVYGLATS
jgi:hypothetical protein